MLDELNKRTANRLRMFAASGLVSFKHLHPWADALISNLDAPPAWLCELSCLKYNGHIDKCLAEYINSEPWEQPEAVADQYVGCLLLRRARGELSWATFLRMAGDYADTGGYDDCSWECEAFYGLLNQLEDAEFSPDLSAQQEDSVLSHFGNAVESVRGDYEMLRTHRRNYGSGHAD